MFDMINFIADCKEQAFSLPSLRIHRRLSLQNSLSITTSFGSRRSKATTTIVRCLVDVDDKSPSVYALSENIRRKDFGGRLRQRVRSTLIHTAFSGIYQNLTPTLRAWWLSKPFNVSGVPKISRIQTAQEASARKDIIYCNLYSERRQNMYMARNGAGVPSRQGNGKQKWQKQKAGPINQLQLSD